MRAYMNITIRVNARQAQAAIRQLEMSQGRLTASSARTAAGMGGFLSGMRAGARHLERFGKNLQWTGRQLAFNFTLPIVAAGAAATKWAFDNERAMVRIQKVYGDSTTSSRIMRRETKALSEAFRALSDLFGITQSEVIGIGAAWAQAGSSGIAVAKQTRLTLEAMVLGEMEAEQATQALIATQAQWGVDTDKMRLILAQLNVVENETAVSMQDLIAVQQRAAGVARTAGVDWRHLAAMTASIVPAAGTGAQAGNSLRTIISRIMAPTNDAADLMKELGIQVGSAAWESENFNVRLQALAGALGTATQAQRNIFSATAASRWQVSRLDILIRDLTDSNGRYAKALAITRFEQGKTLEQQSIMIQYQREIGKVLASSPQGFTILITQLKNLAAEIIVPLLPAILGVAHRLVAMVDAFTRLDPAVQQIVIGGLAFIAIMGPMIQFIGSVILLSSQLVPALGFVATGIKLVALSFGLLPLSASLGMTGVLGTLAGFALRIRAFLFNPWIAGIALIATLLISFREQIQAWLRALGIDFSSLFGAIAGPFRAAVEYIARLFSLLPRTVQSAMLAVVQIMSNAARAVASMFGLFSSVPTVTTAGPAQRVTGRKRGGPIPGVGPGDKIPAMLEAKEFVVRRDGGNILDALHYFGIRGYAGGGPVGALEAFNRTTAGSQARLARNEFAKQRKVIVEFTGPEGGRAADVLVAAIRILEDRLRSLGSVITTQEATVDRWANRLGAANAVLDKAQNHLEKLRERASAAQDALSASQERLSELVNTPLRGMERFNSTIFANEQAQKRLRLEMLKLNQAGRAIEDVESKMSALRGSIELLRGRRDDLRLAGAGSDILGPIDSEIARMEKAWQRMDEKVEGGGGAESKIEKLQKQLDELVRRGEMLELEKSIKFDPLTRQIDKAANAMDSMPFAKILAGIKSEQANIATLTAQYNRANGAVARQERGVERLTAVRDGVQQRYDRENAQLDVMRDRYQKVEERINEMSSALDGVTDSANRAQAAAAKVGKGAAAKAASAASAARAAKAAGAAGAVKAIPKPSELVQRFRDAGRASDFDVPGGGKMLGREGGLGDQSGAIRKLAEQWTAESRELFSSVDIWQPFRKQWERFKTWLSSTWESIKILFAAGGGLLAGVDTSAFGAMFGSVRSAGQALMDWLSGVARPVLRGFVVAWQAITGAVQPIIRMLRGPVREAFALIGDFIRNIITVVSEELAQWAPLLAPAKAAIMTVAGEVGNFIAMLGKAIGFIGVVLATAASLLWPLVRDVLKPVFDFAVAIVRSAMKIIRGIVTIILGALSNDWRTVMKGLLNIVDGIWGAIIAVWRVSIGVVIGIVKSLISVVVKAFTWLWDKLVGRSIIPDMIQAIIEWFKKLPSRVMEAVNNLVDRAIKAFRSMKDNLVEWAKRLREGAVDQFLKLRDAVRARFAAIRDNIADIRESIRTAWDKFWSGLGERARTAIVKIREAIQTRLVAIRETFADIRESIRNAWDKFWSGLGEKARTAIANIREAIQTRLAAIRETFTNIREAIRTAWDKFWTGLREKTRSGLEAIRDKFRSIFGPGGAIRTAFHSVVDAIGRIWDGLKKMVARPVNFVINTVYNKGIRAFWNKIAGKVPGIPELPEIAPIAFRRGGGVPGVGRGDKVPSYLEPGEFVVRRDGSNLLDAARFFGNQIQRFAGGGVVEAGRAALQEFPGIRLAGHSAFPPVGTHGQGSDHYVDRAIDFNYGPGGQNFMEQNFMDTQFVPWIQKNIAGVKQMLWRVANHFDHLHLSVWPWGGFKAGGGDNADTGGGGLFGWIRSRVADLSARMLGPVRSGVEGWMGDNGVRQLLGKAGLHVLDSAVAFARGQAPSQGEALGTGDAYRRGNLNAVQSANSRIVKGVSQERGWHWGAQWNALHELLMRESSFNHLAQNPTSTAYGLYQFLDSTWGSVSGRKTAQARLQAVYGNRYISQRYNDPIQALRFHDLHGWYAKGGIVRAHPGGRTIQVAEGGRDEAIVPLPRNSDGAGLGSTNNFYGNLEFPNVRNGDDAQAFLDNLRTLVG